MTAHYRSDQRAIASRKAVLESSKIIGCSDFMASNSFGIYIQTYPGDYHLSTMLVRSIQHVSPDIPIMIIPGEGMDLADHPFDVPIMPIPSGFWSKIGHQDRDFWAFQGPFERFLFLDADTICTKSLDGLAEKICRQEGDFIFTQATVSDDEWRSWVQDPQHPRHDWAISVVEEELGSDRLQQFDPDHDFFAHIPFNSGVFASCRLAIREEDVEDLNRRERTFYQDVLGIENWTWKSSKLFFRDQGRLNYLVHKLRIPTFPLQPELVTVAGANPLKISFEDVDRRVLDFHIIHYMGSKAPSPSFFSAAPLFPLYARLWSFVGRRTGRYVGESYDSLDECPAFSLWRHYYEHEFGPLRPRERLRWSWPDLRRLLKLIQRSLRLLARSVPSSRPLQQDS